MNSFKTNSKQIFQPLFRLIATTDKVDPNGQQSVGVSAAFLADIQPQVDGCNGIKYNITKDIIEAIFNTYPAVKRKHFESVPHKVSEQDFWQRFFQSHYFHRDRSTTNKDFFLDCSKNDIERALRKGIIDRIKKHRLEEMTQMEDLEDSNSQGVKIPVLNIFNSDRYLSGPIPNGDCDIYNNSYSYDSNHNNSDNNTFHSYYQMKHLVNNWRPSCQNALNSAAAVSALSELSPGGALMKTSHSTNLRDETPLDIHKELKNLTFALNELLRHFWSCFPATTPQIEEKLQQMRNTLERFQYVKIQPFHEKLSREYHTTDVCIV